MQFLFTRSPYSFLAYFAENWLILHEEVRKAVDSNRIKRFPPPISGRIQ